MNETRNKQTLTEELMKLMKGRVSRNSFSVVRAGHKSCSDGLAVMQARPVSNNHESSKRGVEAIPSQGGPPPSASPAIARRDRATDGK